MYVLVCLPLTVSFAIAIASATSMSAVAAPAAKNETTVMETVVVTGSVIGNSDIEDVKEYPGARTVITRDQIEKTAAGSIDNALQRVPGIKVQDESGTGVLPNISVRGLKASRSGHAQFLMDGVPLTARAIRSYWSVYLSCNAVDA